MSKVIERLKLADLKATVKNQTREAINKDVLEDYTNAAKAAKAKSADSPFPPLVIFRDMEEGDFVGDGFTRRAALIKAGYEETDCEVRTGTIRDAIEYGFKANQEHGARLTRADLKHNLMLALKDPAWAELTNTALADLIGSSESFVRANRPAGKTPDKRKTKTGKTVTGTRKKKGDKPAKPAKKAKAKKGKGGDAGAGGGAGDTPKKDEALDKAVDKIAKAIDKAKLPGLTGEAFKAGVADGSVELARKAIIDWAEKTDEQIAQTAHLVIVEKWLPVKAFKHLGKRPDGKTTAEEMSLTAASLGGVYQDQIGGFKFIVFNADLYIVGEKAGTVTLSPKKK